MRDTLWDDMTSLLNGFHKSSPPENILMSRAE